MPVADERPRTLARWLWPAVAMLPPLLLGVAWAVMERNDANTWLARGLYFGMPVVLALAAVVFVHNERAAGGLRRRFAAAAWPLVFVVVATALVVWLVPAAMRMQFDETSLLSTSQGMHRERSALMAVAALPSATVPTAIEWNLDKRPPLFAFLVSLVHDLTGFRPGNVFVVNAAVFFLLLATIATAVRRWLGTAAALAAVAMLGGVPLLLVAARSGGFELLATWLLAVVVVAAIDFVREPTAPRVTWLLASGLVFAQARYESVAVLAVVFGIVRWRVRQWPRDRLGRLAAWTTPTLLAPIVLLLLHSRDSAFYPEANGQALVSAGHFAGHLVPFLGAWLEPRTTGTMAGWLGIVGVPLCLWWLARRRNVTATWLVLAPVAIASAIVVAWFFGDVAEPSALRLYLPAAVFGGLLPLLAVPLLRRRWLPLFLLAAAGVHAGVRLAAVRSERTLPPYSIAVALRAVDAALAGLRPDSTRTLFVSTVAQYLVTRDLPAMTPQRFAQHERERSLAAFDVLVLETPLDALLPQAGDPRAILRARPATLLGRIDGDLPVAAWRLASGR